MPARDLAETVVKLSPIDRAQKLLLEQDRRGAAAILVQQIQNSKADEERMRLLSSLDRVARYFLTDKGQKLYEFAQSIHEKSPALAMGRLREIEGVEKQNILVLRAIALLEIGSQACASARQTVVEALGVHPYASDLLLVEQQALICAGQQELALMEQKKIQGTGVPFTFAEQALWDVLAAQSHLHLEQRQQAREALIRAERSAKEYPEIYYWRWRLAQVEGQSGESEALTYVSLCKSKGSSIKRSFRLDVRLCENVKEVEAQIAIITEAMEEQA